MIKYGIKIWSIDKQWFQQAVDLFKQGKIDFGEIYIVPDSFELEELSILKRMPFFVHAIHYTHKFNLLELDEKQIQLFKTQVVKTADYLESRFIVLHPGVGDKGKNAFKENSKKIFDKRIVVETMAKIGFVGGEGKEIEGGVECFGHTLDQLKFIKEECGFNICLDISHVIAGSVSQKLEYKDFIEILLKELEPEYFHISGGNIDSEHDEHLNVFEGDFDMKWIKNTLLEYSKDKDIYLVFETPKIGGNLDNDAKNIDYFKNMRQL